MAARQFDDLRDLGLCDFKRIDPADAHAVTMNVEHDLYRFLPGLGKKTLQNVHDEFHRRVVVIQDQDFI